jgi:dihydroorotate dehydrogenase
MAKAEPATALAGRDLGSTHRIALSTRAMGLTFVNALGLAAGIDRRGAMLATLAKTGVGHIEVGTVTDARDVAFDRASLPAGLNVGMNFASPRTGIDAEVIEDYAALLRSLWTRADYFVANLSSPSARRTGDTPGVEQLIERLAEERDIHARDTGSCKPLLAKTHAGPPGSPLPRALVSAPKLGLQGIVLVTLCTERLSQCCNELGPTAVISVGGVLTADDAAARLAAGARLVQIYTAFANAGPASVRGLLEQPAHGRSNERSNWSPSSSD